MHSLFIRIVALAIATWMVAPLLALEPAPPQIQSLRLNLFLTQWQVFGPIAIEGSGSASLDHEYVDDETNFRGGNVRFYHDKLLTWKLVNDRNVDLRKELAPGNDGENCIAYAWTQFRSDKDQRLRLALAHDDACVAIFNGKKVGTQYRHLSSSLDQAIYEVDVKAGVNSLLLKVLNGTKEWDCAARFLPLDVPQPLVQFKCMPDTYRADYPVFGIVLLDKAGKAISQHYCSGSRTGWNDKGLAYRLYENPPATEPHSVRLITKQEGFADFAQTFAWQEIKDGSVTVQLKSDRPLQLQVVDSGTGKPVRDLVVWEKFKPIDIVYGKNSVISVPEFQPTEPRCWISAPGYVAKPVRVEWPYQNVIKVLMSRGGCTLQGQVLSKSGKPVPNARIKATPTGTLAFRPEFRSDSNGRFKLHGFQPKAPDIVATVSARGFLSNQRFPVSVSPLKPTVVSWELEKGVFVTGKVTHAKTGKPLAGIEVVTGDSRYSSDKVTAKTNKNGEFEFSTKNAGALTLTAISNDYAPAMQSVTTVRDKENRFDLTMSDGVTIRGLVTDKKGQPIADAQVRVDGWRGKRVFSRSVSSNSKGEFSLEHMPEEEAEVYAYRDGYVTTRSISVSPGKLAKVTLPTRVNYTYRIRAGDKIVPGLSIVKGYKFQGQADYSWQRPSSSVMRSYTPSTGEFTVSANESSDYTVAYRFKANGYGEHVVNLPADATESKTIDVALKPAQMFQGVVVDAATGRPKPNIAVTLASAADNPYVDQSTNMYSVYQHLVGDQYTGTYTLTDLSGKFQLAVPAKDKKVELVLASQDGGFHHITNVPHARFAETDQLLTLPFPEPGSLTGTFKIEGKPVANQVIRVGWSGTSGTGAYSRPIFQAATRTTTDANGNFQTIKLAPGKYQLSRVVSLEMRDSVHHTSYIGQHDAVLLPGKNTSVDIDIPKGFTVSGVAKDPKGNPVTTALLHIQGQRGNEAVTKTDEQGRFTLKNVPSGSFQIYGQSYGTRSNGSYSRQLYASHPISVQQSIDDYQFVFQERSNQPFYQPVHQPIKGTLAPRFVVTPLNSDKAIDSDQLFGKVVAISFWHEGSLEIDALNANHEEFRDNPDVVFLGVCITANDDALRKRLGKLSLGFPVVAYSAMTTDSQLPYVFNAQNGGVCAVIDRTGRFAGENIPRESLAQSIKAALNTKASKQATARLRLRVATGESAMPAYGITVTCKAIDASGKQVASDKYVSQVLRETTWRYPRLDKGGKLIVSIESDQIQSQTKTIANPLANEQLQIDVVPPRRLSGRITGPGDAPVNDMAVLLYGFQTGICRTKTDANGDYSFACFPGQYQVMPQSNDQLAVSRALVQAIMVGAESDPAPQNFKASPAIAIRGKVLGTDGKSVSSGNVMIGGVTNSPIASDGSFELSGVPSKGVVQIVAQVASQYGMIQLSGATADKEYTIQIGQGFDAPALGNVDRTAKPLELQSLTGEKITWEPTGDTNQCVLFCSLWHPATEQLLEAARAKAKQNDTDLTIVSVDFSLEQAKREAKRLNLADVLYAGPNGLTLPKQWQFTGDHRCLIISPDGTIATETLSSNQRSR